MNINQIMKQAQAMQKKMEEAQENLGKIEITGSSGGGMVKITLNGKGEAKKVALDKSVVKAEEADILEDLIVAAINDAKAKTEAETANEMSKVTGGLNLPPGFKLPF